MLVNSIQSITIFRAKSSSLISSSPVPVEMSSGASGVSDAEMSDPAPSFSLSVGGDLANSSQNDSDYVPFSSPKSMTDDEATLRGFDKEMLIEATRLRLSASPAEAQELLSGLDYREDGWCRLCVLAPSKAGGYIQVSWRGANKFAVLQEVVLWARGRGLDPGEQASHLCGNPACFSLTHIIAESEVKNQNRKGCCVWVDCPHCALKIRVCPHSGGDDENLCIKYCNGYADSGAFAAAGLHSGS